MVDLKDVVYRNVSGLRRFYRWRRRRRIRGRGERDLCFILKEECLQVQERREKLSW